MSDQRRAIVVGASTGIGRELALELSRRGWRVGLCGRDAKKMEELKDLCGTGAVFRRLDVTDAESSQIFLALIQDLGGMDLAVINSGTGTGNEELDWEKQRQVISVNVEGFTRISDEAFKFFVGQKRGHLVGISSIAALRGHWHAPAYNASKAYVSNYLEGLRGLACRYPRLPITVTDIQPGFVDTPMTEGNKTMFWVASAEKAARQIADAIERKADHAYITARWRLVAWLLKCVPGRIYRRF